MTLLSTIPPKTRKDLLARCILLEGMSFGSLSLKIGLPIPLEPTHRKGWIGQAVEYFLGADAKNRAIPDFQALSIELKTLPISAKGKVAESSFITAISLLKIHQEQWKTSQCYSKLKSILWLPIEGEKTIPYAERRIGRGFLWSPSPAEEAVLAADWAHLSLLISTGQLECLDASLGDYLQVRPKAANGKTLCFAYDPEGNKIKTLPRGFYLRSRFTTQIYLQAIRKEVHV